MNAEKILKNLVEIYLSQENLFAQMKIEGGKTNEKKEEKFLWFIW